MYRITINIICAVLLFWVCGYNAPIFAKGYMALKSDIGYEAERQRPPTMEGEYSPTALAQPTDISARETVQGIGLDRNQSSSDFGSIENGPGSSIEQQTRFVVDHPYDHELD